MWFWYVITLHYRILVRWFWEQFGIIVIEIHDKQRAEVHHENIPLSSDWAGKMHLLLCYENDRRSQTIPECQKYSIQPPYLLIQF